MRKRSVDMRQPVMEEIYPGFYRVEIPLPQNPLKATNSYIIKGNKRNLIIDTGMNRSECMEAMEAALKELEISLEDTDFFITHLHADHYGLVRKLAAKSSLVYFNEPDAEVMENMEFWREMFIIAIRHGFSEEELRSAIESHPGNKYSPGGPVDLTFVREGDVINIGSYNFRCVVTPGHTRGHTCLYDPARKLLVSGDHILGDITPNISSWDDSGNPLGDYLHSLNRVYNMEVDMALPGHRSIIRDCRGRIDELKEHHRKRLAEVLSILKNSGPGNAYRVASMMEWDIVAENWDDFPLMQKWFATGEALAHLRYLEEEKAVVREQAGEGILFRGQS